MQGREQPIENFYRDKSRRDGHNSHCKFCTLAKNERWRQAHSDSVAEYRRSYYLANRDKFIETSKNYRLQHMDQVRATKKAYRKSHPEYFRELNRAKRLRHLDDYNRKAREYYQKTKISRWAKRQVFVCRDRARKKGVPFSIQWTDLLDRKTGHLPEKCAVFGFQLDYNSGPDRRIWASVDRIIPAMGYVPGNVRVISMAANIAKLDGINDLFQVIPYSQPSGDGCDDRAVP